MITTIKSLCERIEEFNSYHKYITTCEYCNNQILYTKDELYDKIIKCPYCGHTQKILYDNIYNIRLKSISNCFDDDSYKV